MLNRIRGPFNVSSPAIAAGIAAIEDAAHVEAAARHNDSGCRGSRRSSAGWGYGDAERRELPPRAFPGGQRVARAAADEFLKSRGIILRRVGVYGLPGALRLTVGTEAENRAVVGALAEFLEKAIP